MPSASPLAEQDQKASRENSNPDAKQELVCGAATISPPRDTQISEL